VAIRTVVAQSKGVFVSHTTSDYTLSCSQLMRTDLMSIECSCSIERLLRYTLKQDRRSSFVLSECQKRFSGIFRFTRALLSLQPQSISETSRPAIKLWRQVLLSRPSVLQIPVLKAQPAALRALQDVVVQLLKLRVAPLDRLRFDAATNRATGGMPNRCHNLDLVDRYLAPTDDNLLDAEH
jgi:hypothetical protein